MKIENDTFGLGQTKGVCKWYKESSKRIGFISHLLVVLTDHNPLTFINKMSKQKSKIKEMGINVAKMQFDY